MKSREPSTVTRNPRRQSERQSERVTATKDQLGLAVWFIKKIGDAETAIRVIKAAAGAIDAIENPKPEDE
jgi:hypothetical protein